jgi:hypothetical protein
MQSTFSINRAAELVERDRRTLKRVLRDVPPDSKENGSGRWRLRTVIDALNKHEQYVAADGGYPHSVIADRCDAAFAEFDRRFDEMKSTLSLAKRRSMSIALAPLIAKTISLMRARDTADGLHPDHVALRCDRVFMLLLVGFEGACKWTRGEVWEHLDVTGDDDSDAS